MKHTARGFTLTEMLVVVTIVAAMAIASINGIRGSLREARDQKRYKDLDTIEAALYSFYTQNGHFPRTLNASSVRLWFNRCRNGTWGFRTQDYVPGLSPDFISTLPQDPNGCQNGGAFGGYIYTSDGTAFKLAADWTAEEGELCDDPGDKYFDLSRGPGQPGAPVNPDTLFCSVSSPGAENW